MFVFWTYKNKYLFLTKSLLADADQRLLSREDGGDSQYSTVQQHLAELELNPVPEQQHFKGSEGSHERYDAGGKETRYTRRYFGPLLTQQSVTRSKYKQWDAPSLVERPTELVPKRRKPQRWLSGAVSDRDGRCAG